jgi:DNA-binding transcriptional regulator YiaG
MGRPKMTNAQVFSMGADAPAEKPYLFKECGLDNIYLDSGFSIERVDGEEYVSIENLDGLWRAIGLHLVTSQKTLDPKEIRFLRTQMGKTQSEIAKLLRVDDQTVARWEKKKCKIPGPADLILRVLFLSSEVAQPEGREILNELHGTIAKLVEQDAPLRDEILFNHRRADDAWEPRRASM